MVDIWLNILMLLILHGRKIFEKRKTYKYITKQREEMTSMSATIQEAIFD